MVEKTQHPKEKTIQSRTALLHYALSVSAIELLISVFYKKTAQSELTTFRNWQREKVNDFGLATALPRSNDSLSKDIHFTSWNHEKIANFGLSQSIGYKKTLHNHFDSFLLNFHDSLHSETDEENSLSLEDNLQSSKKEQVSRIEQSSDQDVKTSPIKPNLKPIQFHKKINPTAAAVENRPKSFKKKSPSSPVFQNEKSTDDFFKILGYK